MESVRVRLRFLVIIFAAAATGLAADAPAFDAASIKPASIPVGGEGRYRSRIEYSPESLTMLNVDLSRSVEWAYHVAGFQIAGPHLPDDAYDILAKTSAPVPVGQLRLMLHDLLARRFKLAVHRETRMLSVYELAVAKGGAKLPAPKSGSPVHGSESLPRVQNDSFLFQDVTIPEFAAILMQLHGIDLPVVDHTGISGTYDLVLKSAPAAARDGDTSALIAIIQEQLGLRLAAAKSPTEVIVIDHAEKPSEN